MSGTSLGPSQLQTNAPTGTVVVPATKHCDGCTLGLMLERDMAKRDSLKPPVFTLPVSPSPPPPLVRQRSSPISAPSSDQNTSSENGAFGCHNDSGSDREEARPENGENPLRLGEAAKSFAGTEERQPT